MCKTLLPLKLLVDADACGKLRGKTKLIFYIFCSLPLFKNLPTPLIKHEAHFCSKLKNKLRTISASAEE